MKWNGDEHGTVVIHPTGGDGFAWVCPRRTYCDRGHWDWGSQSLERLPAQPSYYFMELATALDEVSHWLAQSPPMGMLEPGRRLLAMNSAGLRSTQDPENPPSWKMGSDGGLVCEVENGGERLAMSIIPVKGGFEFDLQGLKNIDEADRFPRLYRNAESAMREAGLFAQWRLARIPAQVPGPVGIDFCHEVDDSLAKQITAQASGQACLRPGPRR